MSLHKALIWAVPALALLMLALTVTPAEVWNAPANDAIYNGFDPNLVYVAKGDSADVKVSPTSIVFNALPSSFPEVILATTPVQRFITSVDVTVNETQDALTPFRIGLWSPWSNAGSYVVFGPAPDNMITAVSAVNGGGDIVFPIGDVVSQTNLGRYELGHAYRVEFIVDKSAGSLISRVSTDGAAPAVASVDSHQNPKLFSDVALSLSAGVASGKGSTRIALQNFSVDLPHQRLWAVKIADPRAESLLIALAVAGLALLAIAVVPRVLSGLRSMPALPRRAIGPGSVALAVGAIAVYLVGNALLFPLAGHPFDMRAEQLYAYVAHTYGPSQLYFLPNIVSLPQIWNGTPYQEVPFPYEPVTAYLFAGIGWLHSVLLGGGAFSPASMQLEYLIKSVNVLFGLGDGVLIYWILRQIGTGRQWSLLAGALWLFNPAVWFSMSIWGQTHVISLFFILLAVLMIEKHLPTAAWLALAAGCLTRPQMLVFGLLIGVVLLRKFSWRENVSALSWMVIVVFVVLVPFTLATSPSLPVDVMAYTFQAHETAALGVVVTPVSQDAYSVWPLAEYLTQGVTGFHKAFNPSTGAVLGPLTFQRLSQILTLSVVLIVAAYLWFRRRPIEEPGGYLPYVALGVTGFLMLLFGLIATHFLLALPFLILLRRWTGSVAYAYLVIIWTVTTFVTMYGDVGLSISAQDYPLFAAANNAVTKFFVNLYTADRFITVGIVANICAVIWLGYLTLRSPSGQVTAKEMLATRS
jgi:hypothetical protein